MSYHHRALPQRVTRILITAAGMAGAVALMDSAFASRETGETTRPAMLEMVAVPIAAEADVFRARVAVAGGERRAGAHPRTLATFRALRAYPGAPPRVPHGLTAEELRAPRCNTCHERGGWVARFAAYAPVTPHPELFACPQCHAVDAMLAGLPLPAGGPNAVCRQCHRPGSTVQLRVANGWQGEPWPELAVRVDGLPPVVPHELELRGDCHACHTGPSAVAEIRTTHPERTDCRQCHVAGAGRDAVFTRVPTGRTPAAGGQP